VKPDYIANEDGPGPDDAASNLARVRARIDAAERRFGRSPGSVALLGVSKLQDANKIRAAFAAGQTAFGESYVREAMGKIEALADLPLEWHFIGRIQSNKTHLIAEHFAWVHSLCDLRHARRLSDQRPPRLPPIKACCQINVSGESSKGGLPPEAARDFVAACQELPRLRIVGLMTLPAPAQDMETQRGSFRMLRLLRDRLGTPSCPLATLSMGMSDDLEAAIAEGATIVRVGTAVFGPRSAG
jgi:pyridoxal phosphate enzyme (YggS family)